MAAVPTDDQRNELPVLSSSSTPVTRRQRAVDREPTLPIETGLERPDEPSTPALATRRSDR
jgi:hypothetical protein